MTKDKPTTFTPGMLDTATSEPPGGEDRFSPVKSQNAVPFEEGLRDGQIGRTEKDIQGNVSGEDSKNRAAIQSALRDGDSGNPQPQGGANASPAPQETPLTPAAMVERLREGWNDQSLKDAAAALITAMQNRLDDMQMVADDTARERDEAQATIKRLEDDEAQLTAKLAGAEAIIKRLEGIIATGKVPTNIATLTAERDTLERALKLPGNEARARVKELEEEKSTFSEASDVAVVMLQGRIKQLEGALSELVEAVTAEVNEKGGGGYILARLTDARAALMTGDGVFKCKDGRLEIDGQPPRK